MPEGWILRKALALLAALGVSACSTGISKLPGVNTPSQTARAPAPTAPTTPPSGAFRRAPLQNARGLTGIIGSSAEALKQRFGKARIDLKEGDARKLQFLGSACVLDIYLYPENRGAQPIATHVEARRRADGADTGRADCIREVERQR